MAHRNLVGLMWFISGSPKEILVKQLVLILGWDVLMKKLMHKTSLRSSLTLSALTLYLCKPFVWFSQAHRFLFCMTGNRYFPFFYSGYSIPHKGKKTPKLRAYSWYLQMRNHAKILKDKFKSGEEVHIKKYLVHEIACILKVGKFLVLPTLRIPLSLHLVVSFIMHSLER